MAGDAASATGGGVVALVREHVGGPRARCRPSTTPTPRSGRCRPCWRWPPRSRARSGTTVRAGRRRPVPAPTRLASAGRPMEHPDPAPGGRRRWRRSSATGSSRSPGTIAPLWTRSDGVEVVTSVGEDTSGVRDGAAARHRDRRRGGAVRADLLRPGPAAPAAARQRPAHRRARPYRAYNAAVADWTVPTATSVATRTRRRRAAEHGRRVLVLA